MEKKEMEKREGGLELRFSDKEMTAWGGFRLMEEMLGRIGFEKALREAGLPAGRSNRSLDEVEMFTSFLVTIWAGGGRFAHTAMVRFDRVLQGIFGWRGVGSVSTFTRFFGRFNQRTNQEVFERMSRWFWGRIPSRTLTVDMDSTILTRYGEHQEGVRRGYNPHARGRGSHHPLLAFAADLRMVIHGWMRPGNTHAWSNAVAFLKETIALVRSGKHRIGLVRADSGFCYGEILECLEAEEISYIIVGRMLSTVKKLVGGLGRWTNIGTGVAVSELRYQAHGWGRERRMIVVRHSVAEKTGGNVRLLEVPAYSYSIYLTNLTLAPAEVWRLYLGRADSENRIKELKNDFMIGGFALKSFWATEAAFKAALLAYNLMALFRQVVLCEAKQKMLSTLRFECFALGATLGTEGRKRVLRISISPKRRTWFLGLFAKSQSIQHPWPVPY